MPKIIIHGHDARAALARGVQKLAATIESTLGPMGMNAMIDRPIGTPLISRDGVSIASEVELFDRFENMGAQVVREVSMQTNDVAGDGTTTSIVLANGMIQLGASLIEKGAKPVELCRGINLAVEAATIALRKAAKPAKDDQTLAAVARISASGSALGDLVAEAFRRVGPEGVISTDFGLGPKTELIVVDGMSFDRGYISHHMVTDTEAMRAVLVHPYIVLTDIK